MAHTDFAFGVVDGWSDAVFVRSQCFALVSSGPDVLLTLFWLYLDLLLHFQLDTILFVQDFAVSGVKIFVICVFLSQLP